MVFLNMLDNVQLKAVMTVTEFWMLANYWMQKADVQKRCLFMANAAFDCRLMRNF